MQLTTLTAMTIIKFISPTIVQSVKEQYSDVSDIIQQINREGKLDLNILINYNRMLTTTEQFLKASRSEELNKIIITDTQYNVTALYKKFTDQILTVAWITEQNLNKTLKTMDELLWTIHFKDILLIYQGAKQNFHNLFQLCWNNGFISVLLWCDKQLYSYHPYPKIKVVQLNSVAEFQDKTHLHNFQGYEMVVPDIMFPPVGFSYHNKQGKLLRVGYFYKWIEIFLKHHNASIRHEFYDVWQPNASAATVNKFLKKSNFSFVTSEMPRSNDYASSLTLLVTKIQLIVPSSKEIANNLYLIKPFNINIWFYISLCGFLFLMLMTLMNVLFTKQLNVAQALMQTIKIIIFLAVSLKLCRSPLRFYLSLLILFTGLLLTNFYSSSLSRLLTSKVYEPELQQLEDIKRNNLLIFQYTSSADAILKLNIPEYLKQRIYSGNNTELKIKRQALDMSYMYSGQEDLVDFILSQQQFMKKPKARKLKEPLKYKPFFITLPHRSPVIDQFNRYLLYMRENGILKQVMRDTNWHGVYSGNLKILLDDPIETSLTIQYFQYAFLMWICGLMCAFVSFLIEYFHLNIMSLMGKVISKIVK